MTERSMDLTGTPEKPRKPVGKVQNPGSVEPNDWFISAEARAKRDWEASRPRKDKPHD